MEMEISMEITTESMRERRSLDAGVGLPVKGEMRKAHRHSSSICF